MQKPPKKPAKNPPRSLAIVPPKPDPAAVLQVRTWIVEGQTAADIVTSAGETYPAETPQRLIDAALDELADEYQHLDLTAIRGFLLAAYRELYRRANEINDTAGALAALTTSALVRRPSRPVPVTEAGSILVSSTTRRTAGLNFGSADLALAAAGAAAGAVAGVATAAPLAPSSKIASRSPLLTVAPG